jgi:hypothetical protein
MPAVAAFTWRAGQRHRPGLQFLLSTGRHHGFESLEEQRFLLALDFAGGVTDVVSQPFRLRAETTAGWREHIPDFLAVTRSGAHLVDVRPRVLIRDEDRGLFAAAAEAALAAGWRYSVICGWRPHVMATLDMLSSQRRPLADPLGLAPQLLAAAGAGPLVFDDLAGATSCPAVARSACGSTNSGQDHSVGAGIMEANEQVTSPPLPCDRYPAAGHPLRDLPPHRGVPARQPQ